MQTISWDPEMQNQNFLQVSIIQLKLISNNKCMKNCIDYE